MADITPLIHGSFNGGTPLLDVLGSAKLMKATDFPRVADVNSIAVSAEGLTRKEPAREQLLKHPIQPQYLDPLWTLILETIEVNLGFHRFRGATLFINAKNTKLEFSHPSLTQAYGIWEQRWSHAANPEFYNKDSTYVDLAKQVTSEDSALPYDQLS
ncbi:hypothetical protein VC83_09238 [Pseudogymnoascus destructans]|uniref:Uncharacterized protein n=1 Tax=Pseudogymnoascus destructans TaxID=655981 RepID=A0A176ZWX6_9PEZI|nr:uncharacterized protein VC83_09238 [Pseudogymnoascus destructans]OAF54449.1 hypothetical protein VC83_09238 [Pseudogymnoascus destructans]